jgi:predicted ATPase with chaperone activity
MDHRRQQADIYMERRPMVHTHQESSISALVSGWLYLPGHLRLLAAAVMEDYCFASSF